MTTRVILPIILFFFFTTGYLFGQHIIPQPVRLGTTGEGTFVIDKNTRILSVPEFLPEARQLDSILKEAMEIEVALVSEDYHEAPSNAIIFTKEDMEKSEAYRLSVKADVISISVSDNAGALYGAMSLFQLMEKDTARDLVNIKEVEIVDYPRFGWRGLMLDCSRTFISMDYLKKTIDRMSFYKLNVLHLHLTDDHGWRLEINSRPQLTSEGAYFAENYSEPEAFEGFYSQDEIRELLEYAAQKHVEIVPEIEVPGHSAAAIHAYPELSCSGSKVPIYPLMAGSPFPSNDVFCAGNPETYVFFEEVLQEVTALFPSPYVHLGGDEVGKHHWKACEKCQGKMKELGIDDEEKLQSYIMGEVSKNVIDAGKKPIGWDEILDGGVGKEWLVMAWQGHDIGIRAASKGFDVVMSPTSHLYFDYNYRTTPTKKVYSFQPLPDNITEEERKHFLGIQANFWSHIDRTESRIDAMIYPRALALAERAW
jgi:hexosaminidase